MEDVQVAHAVVKEAFHWLSFTEGVATAVGTLLMGLIPVIQYAQKQKRAKEDAKKKAEEEAAAKAPKYLDEKKFQEFQTQNLAQHQEMAAIAERAQQQAGEAVTEIKSMGARIESTLQSNTIKQLETLSLIREGISSSLGDAHEKANAALTTAAGLEGRVKALENSERKVS